jgi:outer membrane protein assembly factor BamB
MKQSGPAKTVFLLPAALAIVAAVAFALWLGHEPDRPLAMRVPGTDQGPGSEAGSKPNPVLAGKFTRSEGQPANLPGAWPQFRGPNRDAISTEATPLARSWAQGQPRELWSIDVGEGFAGPTILNGRVYLMDYDRDHKQDALRCLSLADGREIWRYAYADSVKRNHGMSRTVPAVTDKLVVAMGPKCHVVCLNSTTGELLWGLDLVRQYGATVPPWYAGQCPLIDNGAVILAPGGEDALLLAVDAQTGKALWQTPNPHAWKMTHSSVMPMEFAGQRMYVYCANNGVVGVSAKDGSILWETPDWKISIATVPSPLILEGGRIFLTGGYNAGSVMLQLSQDGGRFVPKTVFRLAPEVFGATQHTPILHDNYLYGVRADGKFACLSLDGKLRWTSGSGAQFGLGSFMLAGDLIFAMNDSSLLRLIEATSQKYTPLAQAQVLQGRDSWAPLALAGDRLIVRDLTRMVCLEVGAAREGERPREP